MVKFRGIDISIVSQFDIRKLPEYSMTESHDPFSSSAPAMTPHDNKSTASCYVPIYPGSQVWFEYTVDSPHPPNASYFFKMSHNGVVITNWDCTAKYGYHGKATYNLEYVGKDRATGEALVKRQAFKFAARGSDAVGPSDDCIEIRVYRIEHRQRLGIESSLNVETSILEDPITEGFCLVNGGLLEEGRPHRRYRFQLLDGLDDPFATFRFFYRSYDFLQNHNVVPTASVRSFSASLSSSDASAEPEEDSEGVQKCYINNSSLSWKSCNSSPNTTTAADQCLTPPFGATFAQPISASKKITPEPEKKHYDDNGHALSSSEESLRIVTKDSIEDLQSSVPRSPRADRVQGQMSPGRTATTEVPPSPRNTPMSPTKTTKIAFSGVSAPSRKLPISPTKMTKKALTLNLEGAEFDLEKKRRPLSPFTNSGMLRKVFGPVPPSAPAAMTEFGPSVREEVEAYLATELSTKKTEQACEKTTRAQRGGRTLMGFLGRRTGRHD